MTIERKAVRAANQSRYQQALRESAVPRSEDVSRAITHALRDVFCAQIVNISVREIVAQVAGKAADELAGRGFSPVAARRQITRSLSKPDKLAVS